MPLARGVVLRSCLPVSDSKITTVRTVETHAPRRQTVLRIAAQLGTQNCNRNLKALYSLKLKPQNPKAQNPETLLYPHSTLVGHYGALNPKPQTLNPKPQTLNPKPETLNPKSH